MERKSRDGVELRSLVVDDRPLLVVGLHDDDEHRRLEIALHERGLQVLPGLVGSTLPRGARVGLVLERQELRLVDSADVLLLRAPREGLDAAWCARAVALRGTLLVVVRDVALGPDVDERSVVLAVDAAARLGGARGGIVGVVEARPTLPLLLH